MANLRQETTPEQEPEIFYILKEGNINTHKYVCSSKGDARQVKYQNCQYIHRNYTLK